MNKFYFSFSLLHDQYIIFEQEETGDHPHFWVLTHNDAKKAVTLLNNLYEKAQEK
jgi:hypothetical protein